MKNSVIFFFCLLIIFSCRKKEDPKPEEPAPVVVQKGTVTFYIVTYDSLGGIEPDAGGVEVKIVQTGQVAVTESSGAVSFNDIPYGLITPVLTKHGFEGPSVGVNVNKASVAVSLPCVQNSSHRMLNLAGNIFSKDSITLSFNFDKPIPSGKFVRIAVLSSTDSSMTANKYGTADLITTFTQSNSINVSHLPALKAALEQQEKNSFFYISAVAISYGLYESNLFEKPLLLGENLFYPQNLKFNKNW